MKPSSPKLLPQFQNRDRGRIAPDARERLVAFFKSRHPSKPVESIVARTKGAISPAAARKMLAHGSGPSFDNFLALTRGYGAEFVVAVMGADAPESLQLAALAERRRDYEARMAQLRAECGFDDVSERG